MHGTTQTLSAITPPSLRVSPRKNRQAKELKQVRRKTSKGYLKSLEFGGHDLDLSLSFADKYNSQFGTAMTATNNTEMNPVKRREEVNDGITSMSGEEITDEASKFIMSPHARNRLIKNAKRRRCFLGRTRSGRKETKLLDRSAYDHPATEPHASTTETARAQVTEGLLPVTSFSQTLSARDSQDISRETAGSSEVNAFGNESQFGQNAVTPLTSDIDVLVKSSTSAHEPHESQDGVTALPLTHAKTRSRSWLKSMFTTRKAQGQHQHVPDEVCNCEEYQVKDEALDYPAIPSGQVTSADAFSDIPVPPPASFGEPRISGRHQISASTSSTISMMSKDRGGRNSSTPLSNGSIRPVKAPNFSRKIGVNSIDSRISPGFLSDELLEHNASRFADGVSYRTIKDRDRQSDMKPMGFGGSADFSRHGTRPSM